MITRRRMNSINFCTDIQMKKIPLHWIRAKFLHSTLSQIIGSPRYYRAFASKKMDLWNLETATCGQSLTKSSSSMTSSPLCPSNPQWIRITQMKLSPSTTFTSRCDRGMIFCLTLASHWIIRAGRNTFLDCSPCVTLLYRTSRRQYTQAVTLSRFWLTALWSIIAAVMHFSSKMRAS